MIDARCLHLHSGTWFSVSGSTPIKLVVICDRDSCWGAELCLGHRGRHAVLHGKSVEGWVLVMTYFPSVATLLGWRIWGSQLHVFGFKCLCVALVVKLRRYEWLNDGVPWLILLSILNPPGCIILMLTACFLEGHNNKRNVRIVSRREHRRGDRSKVWCECLFWSSAFWK